MNILFLESYITKTRQLDLIREELNAEYLKGIDPSQISVQSGKTGDPTAVFALRSIELKEKLSTEFDQLVSDIKEIQEYIFSIADPECREIAIRRCIKGETYEQIGEAMYMHKTTAFYKLRRYIQHSTNSKK